MPAKRLDGRVYEEVLVRGLPGHPLPVDLAGASIEATIEDVQIGNTDENPVPVTDAGESLTVDGPELTSIDAKLPALIGGKIPVDADVSITGVSTEAKQDTLIAAVDGVEALLTTIDTDTGSIDSKLPVLSGGAVPVTGPLTDTQLRASAVPTAPNIQQGGGAVTGTTTRVTLATDGPGVANLSSIDGKLAVPRTPTTTSVASSATSVTILASNASRRGFSISNVSTAKLYLSFSTPATIANSWIEVPAGAFLLLDQQLIVTSAIHGIWASANGTAQVTEYV